jgi:hypothetical protein
MMNLTSKQQYMDTLRPRYLKASKKEKGQILDEYCRNTGEDRKYAIKKFREKVKTKTREERKPRSEYYDGEVRAALVVMWRIFDHSCGQRLETSLREETDRLRKLGELVCSDEVANKLKQITSSTIDKKLAHAKEVESTKRRYRPTHNFPLKNEVPAKTAAELDRSRPGVVQIDFVENCGSSVAGEYVNSLSVTDIFSGWWEGDAVMGKGQQRALKAIDRARQRCPFNWTEMHPDNGSNIMNYHIFQYGEDERITLSRSRPYQKNDNCFVEQKNSTHIRQPVGYLRYDTEAERKILSSLYRNELRLYKNFFQPVIKLESKTRVAGKIRKKYDQARTPYARVMESDQISSRQKARWRRRYESLNPAELKRRIERKLALLQKVYDRKKNQRKEVIPELVPAVSVSKLIIQPKRVRCHS